MPSADRTTVDVEGTTLRVSNLDKVLFPADGTTKSDVMHHYLVVADAILAQLAGRPATRKRWPDGTGKGSFFEKNVPRGAPDWLRTVVLDSPGSSRDREQVTYPILEDRAGLIWAANLAALELHTPQWTVGPRGGVHSPDRLVIDLDPGEPAGLAECVEVAHLVRERLEADDFTVVPVTSGSKGMQLYASDGQQRDGLTFRGYAQELATSLESERRDLVLSNMKRDIRKGKVLLDWSQNTPAKTTVTPYSLRGRERATVAMPRTWDELDSDLEQVHRTEVEDRMDDLGDLMEQLP
ncbi:non-homologous end-joining DNA ligase [Solicola sp. PLA-1-18]|uniref:non-homologous end-joining DNA ligase n=1 Tax=Solicola sp. PLA-1-18 TaxID=3380532 RepID=UPI003B7D082C